jgi:hypothetical protein
VLSLNDRVAPYNKSAMHHAWRLPKACVSCCRLDSGIDTGSQSGIEIKLVPEAKGQGFIGVSWGVVRVDVGVVSQRERAAR